MADKTKGGVFTAKVVKEGKTETKKFSFKAVHPPHFNTVNGRSFHAETIIKIANSEAVDVDEVKKQSLEGIDKDSAQASLQHLVDVGYLYLDEVK